MWSCNEWDKNLTQTTDRWSGIQEEETRRVSCSLFSRFRDEPRLGKNTKSVSSVQMRARRRIQQQPGYGFETFSNHPDLEALSTVTILYYLISRHYILGWDMSCNAPFPSYWSYISWPLSIVDGKVLFCCQQLENNCTCEVVCCDAALLV